ncbi:MAG TPA: septal ring lytic transglycosylase RlpA family protein [Solirubrobacterales bacterium]|nr:septal ring lytic transglycosylase RlpA family protein [Solirubrobacterales bacterium]
MTSKRTIRAIAGLACCATLTLGASSAYAQTGGVPGGTEPSPEPTAPSSGSWTVYKKATWYGPGFWGKSTACGTMLQPTVIGVAHRLLPCGTQVTFSHSGRSVAATVIDRGPFKKGYAWDLTKKTAKRLGFLAVGSGPIQATVTPPAY